MNATRSLIEPLESRRLLSGCVSAAVLGIQPADAGDSIEPVIVLPLQLTPVVPPLQFTPGALIFNATPNVVAMYTGSYTVNPSATLDWGTGGTLIVDVTSQSGNAIVANVIFGQELFAGMTGHVNRHGGFYLSGGNDGSGDKLLLGGHYTAGEAIQNGTFSSLQVDQLIQPTQPFTGTFSLTNPAAVMRPG